MKTTKYVEGGQSISCVTGWWNLPSIQEGVAGALPMEAESGAVIQLNQVYNSRFCPGAEPFILNTAEREKFLHSRVNPCQSKKEILLSFNWPDIV